MIKQLISIFLLISTLIGGLVLDMGGSFRANVNSETLPKLAMSIDQHPHFYKQAQKAKSLGYFFSEILDSEEELSEDKKNFEKNTPQSISFFDSAIYFFGYVSERLAEKTFSALAPIPNYLLFEVFRL